MTPRTETEIRVVCNRPRLGNTLEVIKSRCDIGEAERWYEAYKDDEALSNVRIEKRTVTYGPWTEVEHG